MKPLLRYVGRAVLILYVLLAIVVLGVRYWLLPHIDQWRAPLEQVLSAATESEVQIGKLSAQWQGLRPQLHIEDLRMQNPLAQAEAPPLHIPHLTAHVNLRPLFNTEALRLNLIATLQAAPEQSLQLRGEFALATLIMEQQLAGTVHVQLNEWGADAWQHWIELPSALRQASVDAQLWLQFEDSQIEHLSIDTHVHNGVWQLADGSLLTADSLRFFAQVPWQSVRDAAQAMPLGQRLQSGAFSMEMYAQTLALQDSPLFTHDLQLEELTLVAQRHSAAKEASVQIQQLSMKNSDAQLALQGSWTPQGVDLALGEFDVAGALNAVQIKHLYRYFPTPEVPVEVVQWLEHALVAGVVPEAALRLKGNWQDFPYKESEAEQFYIGGRFEQTEIDYYRPDPDEKGWPKLENADGMLLLRNGGLWVQAAKAVLKPDGKEVVQAEQLEVQIKDLDADELIVSIQGQTAGAAQAYLGLMAHSDLGALLEHSFDQSTATGQWQVPLDLHINVDNTDAITVKGHIDFADNKVSLFSFLPPLESVRGRLYFNETGARAENLKGQWLGGAFALQGEVGSAGKMLQVHGQAQIDALGQYTELAALETFLAGHFAYQLQVGFDLQEQLYVQAKSDLIGVSSSLPSPLAKSAEAAMPLALTWQGHNAKPHQLQLQLAHKLQLQLIENEAASPLFSYGGLSWQQPLPDAAVASQGLFIDIQQDNLDLDAWWEVMAAFHDDSTTSAEAGAATFPDVMRLRLKSNQAIFFNQTIAPFTYTMQQSADQHWRADISSTPVAGTVQWQANREGGVAGAIEARFQRLHWHSAAANDSEAEELQLDLPSLRLSIDDLRWDKWRLGALSLEGVKRIAPAGQWQITQLALQTPHGALQATGVLQQLGAQRGLTLMAQAQSEQIADFLNYIGIREVLAEGKGAVQAQLHWLNFPWATELMALQGAVDLDLSEGRIDQINSRAATVLEFLSLQSLSRLSRLDFDIRGLFKDGFPFDDMKGRLHFTEQKLSTNNFRVVGPAGTIVIEGEANVESEQLDLRAVVVPNVDMSGAAIAAGIALNPVVGIGAFVTQLLFNDPLAKAMTVQYELIGPWNQFEAEEVKLKPEG